jgi:hypothetical protein
MIRSLIPAEVVNWDTSAREAAGARWPALIPEADLRALAHRIVRAGDERAGPFTTARRARLLLAARQLLDECSPPERAESLRAFGARK